MKVKKCLSLMNRCSYPHKTVKNHYYLPFSRQCDIISNGILPEFRWIRVDPWPERPCSFKWCRRHHRPPRSFSPSTRCWCNDVWPKYQLDRIFNIFCRFRTNFIEFKNMESSVGFLGLLYCRIDSLQKDIGTVLNILFYKSSFLSSASKPLYRK